MNPKLLEVLKKAKQVDQRANNLILQIQQLWRLMYNQEHKTYHNQVVV